jgi:WXG100 family type VII secretion target
LPDALVQSVDKSADAAELSTAMEIGPISSDNPRTVPEVEQAHANERTSPSMTGLKVSPEQLTNLGGTCNRTATDVRGQHAGLKSQLMPLFGADWSGAAASQFAALYDQFNKNAEGMSAALDGIGRLLGQAGQSYASVEQQITASFRG